MPRARIGVKCLVYAALMLGVGVARAQEISAITSESNWTKGSVSGDQNVLVVTTGKPKLRQKCKVKSVSDDELICAGRFGRKPVTFRKDDVVALIRPGHYDSHGAWPIFLGFFSAGGGIVYSAAVIASIGTPLIAVAIPVALVGLAVACGGAMAFDDESDTPEVVLYLRPGSQLQFALRQ